MESKNRIQEKIAERNGLKTKLLFIGIAVIGAFVLSGCQEQMATVETKSFKVPVFTKEITFKPIPAQLASKVTFIENSQREFPKTYHKSIELLVNNTNNWSKYQDTSLHRLNLNKESWKDTYEGKGVPLLKISF